MVPIPLIDGQEVPGFREAVHGCSGSAEAIETERGKFVRITPGYIGDQSSPWVFVGLRLEEAPRRFFASTHLAERFGLSGEQGDAQAWVYLKGDGEIKVAGVSAQLGES